MNIAYIILTLFGIGFLGIGLYLLFNVLLTLVFGHASQRWPTTTGIIVSSELKTGMLGSGQRACWASIKYKYKVNEHQYRGSRVGFSKYGVASNNSTKIEVAQAIITQYPKDNEVSVYYFPLVPSISTLEPGFRAVGFAGHFILGIILTVIITYMAIQVLKW